ncbi:MAG: DUF421 domain-containing protein [Oscillospiraceae bacterium]
MATAFFRTLLLYLLLMAGLRLLGKRQIGELEPSELVLTMMLSDLVTVPMQDFGVPLLSGVIPMLVLLSLSMLSSFFSLKSLRFRALVCGKPTVLIADGKLNQSAMRRNRFTLDELLEELRGQGFSDLTAIKYAILENSGQLSLLPYAPQAPLTPAQMQQPVADDVFLPVLLIGDGRVLSQNLAGCGKDMVWLETQLADRHLRSPADVFLLSLDQGGKVLCIPKEVTQA